MTECFCGSTNVTRIRSPDGDVIGQRCRSCNHVQRIVDGGMRELRVARNANTGTFHLALHESETFCGRYDRTRPLQSEATARRTVENVCGTCRKIAETEHKRALIRVYERAEARLESFSNMEIDEKIDDE